MTKHCTTIAFADKRKLLLVIQIQEALWRINYLKPESRKKSFAFQKKSNKENALELEGKSCRQE